jgi:ketopantoate hydroxymethyltransferase
LLQTISHTAGGTEPTVWRAFGLLRRQILVIDDLLGLFTEFTPKFVKRYRCLGEEIRAAAREYAEEVRQGRLSAAEHTYSR